MKSLGILSSGLNTFITEGFKLLNLITFFTSGPKESKAWTIPIGANAPDAAGKIHTDFKKGFIRAEVISYQDFLSFKGELNCCLLYTSPSPRDQRGSRMPSSA